MSIPTTEQFEAMALDAAHLEREQVQSIKVGDASGGICAIDLVLDEDHTTLVFTALFGDVWHVYGVVAQEQADEWGHAATAHLDSNPFRPI